MNKKSLRNNQPLRFFLRCAMMMATLLPMTLWGQITPTTNVNEKHLYLIQTNQFESFYITPNSSNLNTANLPHASMLWYYLEAEDDNGTKYYYIVNNSSNKYMCHGGGTDDNDNSRGVTLVDKDASNEERCKFKFVANGTAGFYNIVVKGSPTYYAINKRSGNVSPNNIRLTNSTFINNINSKWKFVPYDGISLDWPNPTFTVSTDSEKYYYRIRNKKDNTYYISTNPSTCKVTYSSTISNDMVWYFKEEEAPTGGLMKYYYIINPEAEDKYMYYDGTATDGSNQSNAVSIKDINEANADPDRFLFVIVQAAVVNGDDPVNGYYMIVPKLLIGNLWTSNSLGKNSPRNGTNMGIIAGRGDNIYSHWSFEPTVYSEAEAPTITNNFDGTISLSTTTPNAKIYYTTNGTTPSSSNGTLYASAFSLGNATIIKAITYNSDLSESSTVTTYDVPKYTTPTISFDDIISEVTINGPTGATIYYTTDESDPTANNYTGTGTTTVTINNVSSGTTVKAIATHAGYLNSDVATWPDAQHDYSQDYLTFRITDDGTIGWKAYGNLTKTIEYSINNGAWTSWTSTSEGATIPVQAGNLVRLRGTAYPYATSKSAYSGFEGGTATYDIEGNIHSLIYGDNFAGNNTMPNNSYMFCSLFKNSKAISAENLILPATSLRTYCYRALFSYATSLEKPCALPATELAKGCYWYMFEQSAITTAPELNAATLVDECYGHMFEGCVHLNSVKCIATSISATNCKVDWLKDVSSTGTFVKESNTTWPTSTSGIPSGWTTQNEFLLYSPEINCDGEQITITCATQGASIYYRLNQTGNFLPYSSPIPVNSNTTVEAYSKKDNNTSVTVTYTFEIYANPFDESNRSLDSWTFGNTQVTLPYSVNGIDGHSSSYSKGTHTFETTITLFKEQPTYLWFQHADQSADIYVDDIYVTTHWGGYNAFFVDITNYVHIGTNRIKVVLNNTTRNTLAPCAGDFNFNATLGKVKLLTSPIMPSMDYGYDGFHITSSVSDASATINIKTSIPEGASVTCKIDADGENYHFTETKPSTGSEMTFTTTISNPHLWNGTKDPFLYNVTLEIYHNDELYHKYERPYGFRYYNYVYNNTDVLETHEPYTGFLLNGKPYLLRGVCIHHDLEGKANALDDDDIANDFAIIQELGCNFVRLAHYPHPKEVYDWCDRLGIVVQTEVPCVNKFQNSLPQDYYDHLYIQYEDMVRQHYNHPCILFWGLFNEATTDDASIAKTRLEAYRTFIKGIDPERWVGYVVSHSYSNPSNVMGNPDLDWFGCNIYVGWYINKDTNDPTSELNKRITSTITNLSKPLAFSEYGCGGTQHCHSDNPQSTTEKGNYPRHDIEYQMWLHEGHIAAIKNKPELLFTSQWQLFDIAVSNRQEGYKVCLDGETVTDNNELKFLNNKGLVERDHKTKKDPFYLYKAWWNQDDKFVHICGKDYEKLTDRVIKCYTNDGSELTLYVNNVAIQTVTVENNIATFKARDFNRGDVIRVSGDSSDDTFSFPSIFTTDGNWNVAANWIGNAVPANGGDAVINAECTIPNEVIAQANNITFGENGSLTVADGGQLYHNNQGVNATVQKNITAYTVSQNDGESLTNGWYFIASPTTENFSPSLDNGFLSNTYDLFYYDEPTQYWRNHMTGTNNANSGFSIEPLKGYLYANNQDVTLVFQGNLRAGNAMVNVPLSYTSNAGNAKGFNLVGNPFAHNVTNFTGNNVAAEVYRMNDFRNNLMVSEVSTDTPLPPGEGFFVKATGDNASITFNSSTRGENVKHGHIALEISENGLVVDRFIVKNEGEPLEKFTLNENSTKIFATRDQQDWAVVTMEGNEQAVNFKAAKDGTYTISLGTENTTLHYLHLIDNKTGNEVDLLQTPSYCFEAKTMDYESRFRLVFNNDNSDNTMENDFAFIHNGEIVLNGEGTVQIVDVMGRIVVSHRDDTRPISTESMAPGIYVLRLIQSDKVRTQKIVID